MYNYIRILSICVLIVACKSKKGGTTLKDAETKLKLQSFKNAAAYSEFCSASGVPMPRPLSDSTFWQKNVSANPKLKHFGTFGPNGDLYIHRGENNSGCALIVQNGYRQNSPESSDSSGGLSGSYPINSGQIEGSTVSGSIKDSYSAPTVPSENVPLQPNSDTARGPSTDKVGAICWSGSSHSTQLPDFIEGAACFWEDSYAPVGLNSAHRDYLIHRLEKSYVFYKSGEVFDACTRCHRGDTPLIGYGYSDSDPNVIDPAFVDLPQGPYNLPIVPDTWPKNELPDTPLPASGTNSADTSTDQTASSAAPSVDYQCAKGCHTIPVPTDAYCDLASRMHSAGLMRGMEYGIAKNAPGARPTEAACRPYIAFLTKCRQRLSKYSLGNCFDFVTASTKPAIPTTPRIEPSSDQPKRL